MIFLENPLEFFKNGNYSKLFVKCVSSGNTPLKSLSTLFVRFFSCKSEKFKSEIETEYFKKTLSSSKKLLYQNGKAENMPVVDGRFIYRSARLFLLVSSSVIFLEMSKACRLIPKFYVQNIQSRSVPLPNNIVAVFRISSLNFNSKVNLRYPSQFWISQTVVSWHSRFQLIWVQVVHSKMACAVFSLCSVCLIIVSSTVFLMIFFSFAATTKVGWR